MEKRKIITALCVILAVICGFVFLNARPDDYYNTSYYEFDVDGALSGKEEPLAIAQGETDYVGVAWKTKVFDLPAGTYTITIDASSEGSANYCELYSHSYVSGDNVTGKVFAKEILSADGKTSFTVTVPQSVSNMEVRIVYITGNLALRNISVTGTQPYLTDSVFIVFMVAGFGAAAIYLFAKNKNRRISLEQSYTLSSFQVYSICVGLALLATLPMMRTFLTYKIDIDFHLIRIEGLYDGLRSGQFPVRISPYGGSGYGYADQTMYPNLFLYIPALFRLCGVSPMVSFIAFFFTINTATAFIAYYSFRRLLRSDLTGLMAAALYTFSLYRLGIMYSRAALGELIAASFFPLIILGMYEIIFGEGKRYGWLVIGICGVGGSHVLSASIIAMFCAGFTIVFIKRILAERRWLALLKAVGLGLLLNLWFVIPFAVLYLNGLKLPFNNFTWTHVVYLPALFSTGTNSYGEASTLGQNRNMLAHSVGIILGIGIILFLARKWLSGRRSFEGSEHLGKIGNVSLAMAAISLVFASNLFPWRTVTDIPLLGRFLTAVQHPWRYLSFASVFLCIVAAIAVMWFAKTETSKRKLALCVVVIAVVAAMPYLDNYITSDKQITLLKNKHYTVYNGLDNVDYRYAGDDIRLLAGRSTGLESNISDIKISGYNRSGTNLIFAYEASSVNEGDFIEIPVYYYPGYSAATDGGTQLETQRGTFSVVRIMLPAGTTAATIRVTYTGLWIYRAGDAVSAVTVAAVIAVTIIRKHRKQPDSAANAEKRKDRLTA